MAKYSLKKWSTRANMNSNKKKTKKSFKNYKLFSVLAVNTSLFMANANGFKYFQNNFHLVGIYHFLQLSFKIN